MNILNIIDVLGQDADLLLRSDNWLTCQKLIISQELSIRAAELRKISAALALKTALQQKNLVAVKREYNLNNIRDVAIEIMPLREAVEVARTSTNPEISKQLGVWKADSYDVDAA